VSKQRGERQFCGAIDIGGTKISAALFTADGTMSCKRKVPVDKEGGKKVAGQVVELIQDLVSCSSAEWGRLSALGICVPGVVYHNSGVVWAPNIAGWRHFHLRSKIREKTKLPFLLESDRSSYVIGEQWRGIAKGLKNIIFLAVGTGIGAGLMIDGRLCRGSEDIAGAVGWFALNPDYKPEYAEMGCFEAEASGNSVARRAVAMLQSGEPSLMRRMVDGKASNISAQTVIEAARRKDLLALRTIELTVQYLAMGIANLVSLLNPEMIVLGGGLFKAGEILLRPVRAGFRKWAQPLAAETVRIELSRLGEDAGLYGAAKLAWQYQTELGNVPQF
jgi:glucokinase